MHQLRIFCSYAVKISLASIDYHLQNNGNTVSKQPTLHSYLYNLVLVKQLSTLSVVAHKSSAHQFINLFFPIFFHSFDKKFNNAQN